MVSKSRARMLTRMLTAFSAPRYTNFDVVSGSGGSPWAVGGGGDLLSAVRGYDPHSGALVRRRVHRQPGDEPAQSRLHGSVLRRGRDVRSHARTRAALV